MISGGNRAFKSKNIKYILLDKAWEVLQLFKAHLWQIFTVLDAIGNCIANYLVGISKGGAFTYQIVCQISSKRKIQMYQNWFAARRVELPVSLSHFWP